MGAFAFELATSLRQDGRNAARVIGQDGGDRPLYEFATETPDDWWEVEALFDTCFAPGREALSSYRLRDGVVPVAALCSVARDDTGTIAGAIRFWPIAVGDSDRPVLLLGPVAIHPTRQGEGLGAQLIRGAQDRARVLGWQWMILVGDAPYYGRFGFVRATDLRFPPPTNPDRLLICPLGEDPGPPPTGEVCRWTRNVP